MNTEYLLDAIGLLDDDLIQEAERYYRRKSRPNYRQWLAWAACFAVVIVLGYGATHLRMGGGNSSAPNTASGGAAGNTASSSTCQQAPIESNGGAAEPSTPAGSEDLESPSASIADPNEVPSGIWSSVVLSVVDNGKRYTYRHDFDDFGQEWEPQLDALPDNCRSLGEVAESGTEGYWPLPHTDVGWYAGCSLWIQGEGWEGPVYLELPEGGYLIFEYSQTYDLPS